MENMRILEIAIELGKFYQARAQANLDAWQANQDAERRKIELTPPEGWPGKNEEQRSIAREKVFAEDTYLQTCKAAQADAQKTLTLGEGEIQKLETERRALEFTIRAMQVEALNKLAVNSDHPNSADAKLFDGAVDQQIEAQVDQTLESSTATFNGAEFPF